MRIDRNPVCGRGFDDAQVMVHLFLPVVPDEDFITIGIARNNPASVRDIAGLHRVDAEFAIKRHRVIKLALVDIDIATRFVMADDAHALLARVPSDFSDVEIGIGGGEVVVAPIAEPIAVPAKVPTFDQHAAETMLGGEIDMAFGVCRRGAVFFARCPTALIEVHFPPDADVFVWDHPADIAQGVGLVEVEDQRAFEQARRAIGNLYRAPRCVERALAHDLGPARAWAELRAQPRAFHPSQPHSRIVDQGGFVKRHMRAVLQYHRDRRVHGGQRADRRTLIEIFVAIPVARGDRPCLAIRGNPELGKFLGDVCHRHAVLFGKLDAETEPVVEHAHSHCHFARGRIALAESHRQFVVAVSDEAPFTPGLLPPRIHAGGLFFEHGEIAPHRVAVGEDETDRGRIDHLLAIEADRIGRGSLAAGVQRRHDAPVGGCDAAGMGHGRGQYREG